MWQWIWIAIYFLFCFHSIQTSKILSISFVKWLRVELFAKLLLTNIWSFFFSVFFSASASQRDSSSSKDNNPGAYGSKQNSLDLDAFKIGPYFDKAASKNVTALLGKTAYLNCRVKNLGNKTVSGLICRQM